MANYNLFDAASLAMVPVGYKANKLYSVKPDTGAGDFDFSRASYATRVNADGLIEKERGNLLLQSNTFNTTWTAYAISSITNGESGYDGSSDAWLLNAGAAGGNIAQSLSVSGVHTFSIYAKKGTANGIRIRFDQTTDTNVYVDLRDGSVGTAINDITSITEDVGGGWYRVKFSMLNAGLGLMKIYPTDGGTNAADGSIYIQDAQLEQGLVAKEYIETTTSPIYKGVTDNIPRIDYTSGCGSLLLEPSRTNLVAQSEIFNVDSSWFTSGRPVIETNATTSPEGLLNASKLTFAPTHTLRNASELTFTNGYSYSIFVKKDIGRYVTIFAAFFTTNAIIGFDLDEGTCQEGGVIEPYEDGWYRISVSKNVSGDADKSGYFYLYSTDSLGSTTSVGGNQLYVYGAQIEEGSYPTSYIPTYGSSVTRVEDSANINSAASLIGQDKGVFFIEKFFDGNYDDNGSIPFSIDGVSSYKMYIWFKATGEIVADAYNGAVSTITTGAGFLKKNTNYKIAVSYSKSTMKLYVNGQLIGSVDNPNIPTSFNIVRLQYVTGAYRMNITKQALLFVDELTNNELAALTRPYDTYQEWVDGEGLTWESKTCTTKSILNLQNL
jgi:hypothetical protein